MTVQLSTAYEQLESQIDRTLYYYNRISKETNFIDQPLHMAI